jgi:mRNA interferase RelE/StbE
VKVDFSRTFEKDLEALLDSRLLARLEKAIEEVRRAQELTAVHNLKRLAGKQGYYRIRVGNFRIGFELVGDTVMFLRCLDRKDIYRFFP